MAKDYKKNVQSLLKRFMTWAKGYEAVLDEIDSTDDYIVVYISDESGLSARYTFGDVNDLRDWLFNVVLY